MRDAHSDYLKAVAIFGVVCIHAGLPFHDAFRFGVPVFVGLWAFYVEKALARRPPEAHRRYLGQRLVELGVPYLAWTLLYIWMFHASRLSVTPLRTIVGGWFGGFGWAGQFYFIVLFQLIVLFPLLRRWATQRSVLPVIVAGGVLNVLAGHWLFDNRWVAVIGDRLFIYWIPYVFMGIALARGQFGGKRGLWVAAVVLLLLAPFETVRIADKSAYLAFTVTLASLLLLVVAVASDRAARNGVPPARANPLAAAVAFVGRNTFPIYVGNVLMLEISKRSGFTDFALLHGGSIGLLAVVALALAGCLAIGWVLKSVKLGILVGNKS